jgi:hypothetical protein
VLRRPLSVSIRLWRLWCRRADGGGCHLGLRRSILVRGWMFTGRRLPSRKKRHSDVLAKTHECDGLITERLQGQHLPGVVRTDPCTKRRRTI